MSNDFDEFAKRLGRDVPTYRKCHDCADIFIVNPDTYDKPKVVCDPGFCEYMVPFCVCNDRALLSEKQVTERCQYPNCARTPPAKNDDDDE